MRLTLTVLRCPDTVTPETRTITGGEYTVGRGPGVDWVLTDPKNLISRRHFTVTFRGGDWRIVDESSNGTFPNREDGPIGKGNERVLRDHDRLRVGPYELEVHVGPQDGSRQDYAPGYHGSALTDGFDDPFADPLRPADAAPPYGAPFAHRTQDDHSSVLNDAIRPAQPIGHMPLHTGGLIPADELLSEDWEKDLLEGMSNTSAGAAPESAGSASAYVLPNVVPAVGPGVASAGDAALLERFLAGVGLPDARPSDPAATLQKLGAAFRALVSGLRSVLIARASIKSEFRIEQTMIRARGNNPLKFSANDDDAVAALLGVGRHTDMDPATAVADALRDIRLHELASMAAMQSAIRALMEGLDPEKIRQEAEHAGGKTTLLPGQRKARAWDAYTALYNRTSQALSDDFDSAFGKAFARAYEEALDELSISERP